METVRRINSRLDPDAVPVSLGELVASIRGRIVTPGDPQWDAARQAWNLAVDQRPALVAMPLDDDDVRAILRHARNHGLRVAPQATGHAAGALGSLADTILLSTRHMRGVEIDATSRIARVQAGTLWHEVTEATIAARVVSPLGFFAQRRRRRVHARRWPQLVGAPAWPGREPCDGDRDRHRRRRDHAGNAGGTRGVVLGAAWRRGSFGVVTALEFSALPLSRGLRGHVPVALRASPRRPPRVVRVDP